MSGSLCVSLPNRDRPLCFAFDDETTVGEVKEFVIDQTGFVSKKFTLTHGPKPLNDDKCTLKSVGITNGSTLNTTPTVPGGCSCECGCTVL